MKDFFFDDFIERIKEFQRQQLEEREKTLAEIITKYDFVVGTSYEVIRQTEEENQKLKDAFGICEIYSKKIVLRKFNEDDPYCYENMEALKNKTFRHEIIHAFFAESGLRNNCSFAEDEELVDWIAIQFPKMLQIFEKLKIER